MRAALVADGADVETALELARGQPSMTGAAARRRASRRRRRTCSRGGRRPRRGRRLRREALDPPAARRARGGRDGLPARRRRRHARRASTASCSRTAPATPSRSSTRRRPCASCSAACPCSGSASATSCSRSRPGLATFKLPFGHRGANHPVVERTTRPRARHEPEPRLRGRAQATARAATHESLYDGTVEGLAYPELRARSVQFHPEAGPGPHDAWPILGEWVEEVRLAAA